MLSEQQLFMSWLTVFIVIEDGALNAQFMTSANDFANVSPTQVTQSLAQENAQSEHQNERM